MTLMCYIDLNKCTVSHGDKQMKFNLFTTAYYYFINLAGYYLGRVYSVFAVNRALS